MRPQPHNVGLVLPLVGDPGADQLLAEDAAGSEEVVVGLQRVERLVERARDLCNAAVLLEQVPIGRLAGVEIPAGENVITEYPIAVLRGAGPEATAFVDFVRSSEGQRILAGFGFGPA